MDSPVVLLLAVVAFSLGIAAAWLFARAELIRLRTLLEAEQQAAGEKLRLLNEAQAELSNAFRALSDEALKSNNQSFLHLAQATLATFQERAKGDLELRQQAIGDLVQPLRESLQKVDERIREI